MRMLKVREIVDYDAAENDAVKMRKRPVMTKTMPTPKLKSSAESTRPSGRGSGRRKWRKPHRLEGTDPRTRRS